jgi:hypothetical protein
MVCLISAAALFFLAASEESAKMWQAAFTRVGLLMLAFWLALPPRGQSAEWAKVSWPALATALLAIFVVARFRWTVVPVLIFMAIIGVVLRPREKRRPVNTEFRKH